MDVKLSFDATTMLWFHIHYRVQEISEWRNGTLENLALNTRYLVGDRIVRQQWDTFQRHPDGLQAQRVQGKTLADFRRQHPGFVQYWDPAKFGQPWLQDYPSAMPERRADLDLPGAPLTFGLRSPLAMAFYWIRWLPPGGQDIPVFLPGFKADRLVDLPITGTAVADGTQWQAPIRYPALSATPISTATAWTSFDRHLLRLAFALHTPRGSSTGWIKQDGCEGNELAPVRP